GDGGSQRDGLPGNRGPVAEREGEGGMSVRATVHVSVGDRLEPMPFLSDSGRPVAWLNIGENYDAAVNGEPEALRELAAAAVKTADEAEELLRVAGLMAAASAAENARERPAA